MLTKTTPVTETLRDRSRALFTTFCLEQSTQVFYIEATRLTTLVSNFGLRFTFAPRSFQTIFGEPVQGEVEIQLREVADKNSMILCDRLTTSEDRLLETLHQFWIGAFQNGMPLQLSIPIGVEMPVPPHLSNVLLPRLFVGSASSTANPQHFHFDWKLVVDKTLRVKKLVRKKYFQFYLTELNWFACSMLQPKKVPRTMVSARGIAPVEELEELAAYVVFQRLNAVTRMYPNGSRFTGVNIPANQAATIVMIGFRQGVWFYGAHKMDKTSGLSVNVTLEPVVETQLLEYLKKL